MKQTQFKTVAIPHRSVHHKKSSFSLVVV